MLLHPSRNNVVARPGVTSLTRVTRDDVLEGILASVRERGGRVTTPRRAIVTALVDADHHVTAEDIADAVQRAHPEVHRSTVYRTLDTLTEMGVIDHVHLGHGPAVYHFTDDAHHHLVCQRCGRVIELPLSVLTPVQDRVARDYRFHVDATHFAIAGHCADCVDS
jgi:Fur family transcriptional regulator, ferric uptake regulator